MNTNYYNYRYTEYISLLRSAVDLSLVELVKLTQGDSIHCNDSISCNDSTSGNYNTSRNDRSSCNDSTSYNDSTFCNDSIYCNDSTSCNTSNSINDSTSCNDSTSWNNSTSCTDSTEKIKYMANMYIIIHYFLVTSNVWPNVHQCTMIRNYIIYFVV